MKLSTIKGALHLLHCMSLLMADTVAKGFSASAPATLIQNLVPMCTIDSKADLFRF
jgi:hypothetical protein